MLKYQKMNTLRADHHLPKRSNRWLMITTKNSHKMNLNKQKLAKFCPFHLLCQDFQFPDITGGGLNSEATFVGDGVYKGTGCVKATNDGGGNPNRNLPAGSQYAWCWWGIDASWSNIKYGASATVQPIAFQALMIVKA